MARRAREDGKGTSWREHTSLDQIREMIERGFKLR